MAKNVSDLISAPTCPAVARWGDSVSTGGKDEIGKDCGGRKGE